MVWVHDEESENKERQYGWLKQKKKVCDALGQKRLRTTALEEDPECNFTTKKIQILPNRNQFRCLSSNLNHLSP